MELKFKTKILPGDPDEIAPDGSEIRILHKMNRGQLTHCTLAPGQLSKTSSNKTVEEVWYCIQGEGRVWRKQADDQKEVCVCPGVSLTIPVGTHFQFRNDGTEPLCFLIATMPPWPGDDEAAFEENYWEV